MKEREKESVQNKLKTFKETMLMTARKFMG